MTRALKVWIMTRSLIFLYFLIFSISNIKGQEKLFKNSILTSDSINDFNYDSLLKKIADESNIIGIGEATHGTHEFYQLSLNIIKTLVVKYNYKYFIAEAGFYECNKINDYIMNGIGNPRELIGGLPTLHRNEDMLAIIEWMRLYNSNKRASEMMKFYGMDRIHSSYETIISDTMLYNINPKIVNQIIKYSEDFRSLSIKRNKNISSKIRGEINSAKFSTTNDSLILINYLETIDIYVRKFKKRFYHTSYFIVREKILLNNIVRIKECIASPEEKIIIWGFNGHISKNNKSYHSLGYYLNKKYKYSAIGTDFFDGSFAAYDIDRNYIIGNMQINPQTLTGKIYSQSIYTNLFMNLDKSPIGAKKEYYHSVGGMFDAKTNLKYPFSFYDKILGRKSYNSLFIIKQSTPTKFLQ